MFLQANITVVDSFKIKYKLYTFFFRGVDKSVRTWD